MQPIAVLVETLREFGKITRQYDVENWKNNENKKITSYASTKCPALPLVRYCHCHAARHFLSSWRILADGLKPLRLLRLGEGSNDCCRNKLAPGTHRTIFCSFCHLSGAPAACRKHTNKGTSPKFVTPCGRLCNRLSSRKHLMSGICPGILYDNDHRCPRYEKRSHRMTVGSQSEFEPDFAASLMPKNPLLKVSSLHQASQWRGLSKVSLGRLWLSDIESTFLLR